VVFEGEGKPFLHHWVLLSPTLQMLFHPSHARACEKQVYSTWFQLKLTIKMNRHVMSPIDQLQEEGEGETAFTWRHHLRPFFTDNLVGRFEQK
jgi:hypothetical protein